MSVRELYNSLVGDTNDGDLKDARDEEDNIIISYYTLCSLFPPQLKQMLAQYKILNVVFMPRVYIHHCYPGVIGI